MFRSTGLTCSHQKRDESGGFQLRITEDEKEIQRYVQKNYLFESFNTGQEFSVESFVHQGNIQFTNITQYFEKLRINMLPYDLADKTKTKILSLNQKIIEALKIEWGMTHAEYYLTKEGKVLFGEIALRPPGGYIMDLLKNAYGFSPWEAYASVEQGQNFIFPQQALQFSCAFLLSANGGIVKSLQGFDQLHQCKSYIHHSLKVNIGDRVKEK
ncbi:MAG: ATP-grasp domain-containing protein [Bdellovibrionota bacterium]